MRTLETLQIRGVQRKGKEKEKEKTSFCELESLFFFIAIFSLFFFIFICTRKMISRA
jgi:capsule polysaccharide export protein KpsE/RkpR